MQLQGYDAFEAKENLPRIIKELVAEKKMDEYLKKQQFIGTGKVAGLLGKHRNTIQNWAKEGKLNAIQTGKGGFLFSRAEILEIITEKKSIE